MAKGALDLPLLMKLIFCMRGMAGLLEGCVAESQHLATSLPDDRGDGRSDRFHGVVGTVGPQRSHRSLVDH